MKQTQELVKAQANMLPGVIAAEGFLGKDTRPLGDIIEADEELMRSEGLDFDEVHELLADLLKKGMQGLGEAVTIDQRWLVRVDETRGTLPSPWEDGIFHKVNCEVEVPGTQAKLVYNELCLHLLKSHHFLQGRGSPFRLDPATIKAIVKA